MILNGMVIPFLFMAFTGLLGLVVSLILLFSNSEKTLSNRLLALSILSISYVLLFNASILTNLYKYFPSSYKALSFITFFIGPFSFLYVRSVLRQEYRLSKFDFLFFFPSLLAIINRIPFFKMSTTEKASVITDVNQNLKMVLLESEGLLPPGYLSLFRIVLTLVFSIAQMTLVVQWKKKLDKTNVYLQQNNELIHWLKIYSILILTSLSVLFIQTFLQVSSVFHFEQIIMFTMGLTNLIASIMLFARPRILYGMAGWMQEKVSVLSLKDSNMSVDGEAKSENRQTLTLLEGKNYTSKLQEHFKSNKRYLDAGYTIKELSRELNIPVYQLSSFINQEYQKSFVQYINDQRFQHVLEMKKEDPDFSNYTIDYIGKKIGFSSRTSFVEFVKKRTGKTPSEFLRGA